MRLCYKCKAETGNYFHCFWSCVKLQIYWSGTVNELCVIFGVPIELEPLCLLFGLPDGHIISVKHKSLLNLEEYKVQNNRGTIL